MYQHGGDIYTHKDILDFSTNINPFGPPDSVIDAAYEGIKSASHYPDSYCNDLREELSKTIHISKDFILCGNGAADLIFSFCLALKPKKALIPIPTFQEYEQALISIDCNIEYYPMKVENDFILSEDFLKVITKDLDVIFLCNPNNPTGQLISKNLIIQILQKCIANNILLVIDECFMDFVDTKEDYSFIEECKKTNNIFILKAFTKLYAIPGLRLGYILSSNIKLLQKMKQVTQPWNVSIPAQAAGIAALKEEEYVHMSLQSLRTEKIYLKKALSKMNVKIYDSKANYIFFRGDLKLYNHCLNKGILIRNCSNYIGLDHGFYRIAIKDHVSNEKLVQTLREVI